LPPEREKDQKQQEQVKQDLQKTKKLLKDVQAQLAEKDRLVKGANEEKTKLESRIKDLENSVRNAQQKSTLLKD
jgi:predicted  nucleic acid-binding Zn-ribbon protein